MDVRILGAHNCEARGQRLVSLLIDGILALDAGGLTSSLSLPEQEKVRAVLLTHHHFDHTRDLVTLGANGAVFMTPVEVYALRHTFEIVIPCLLDGRMYADFSKWPSEEKPFIQPKVIEPFERLDISGYEVLPVPVKHAVPSVGYQVSSKRSGASLFYTGDTGPGLKECWRRISPQLLIIEVSGINKFQDFLRSVGHLSARLLKEELVQFHQIKGYLPRVLVTHIPPYFQREVEQEIQEVRQELEATIDIGYEDMQIVL
ncbi:MAG TPA: MBL fold metallo-hydrolase [Dehalococcoidia bacterium]|nr:MBL fold metallo-hydrolase [Dehalococcoidia bacterium]